MASSRLIAAGETYTPGDINNLRADVLDPVGGHVHDGTNGARIPFSGLDVTSTAGSVAPSGGAKSYNDIANHVAASQGVHGLGTNAYVMGAASAGLIVQGGKVSLSGIITFPAEFTSGGSSTNPLSVVATLILPDETGHSNSMGVTVRSVSSTGAVLDIDYVSAEGTPTEVYWMAIGMRT